MRRRKCDSGQASDQHTHTAESDKLPRCGFTHEGVEGESDVVCAALARGVADTALAPATLSTHDLQAEIERDGLKLITNSMNGYGAIQNEISILRQSVGGKSYPLTLTARR
jgi:hypothetical protein